MAEDRAMTPEEIEAEHARQVAAYQADYEAKAKQDYIDTQKLNDPAFEFSEVGWVGRPVWSNTISVRPPMGVKPDVSLQPIFPKGSAVPYFILFAVLATVLIVWAGTWT